MTSALLFTLAGALLGLVFGFLKWHKPWMQDQLDRSQAHIEWQRLIIASWKAETEAWIKLYGDLKQLRAEQEQDGADWWKKG